MIPRSLLQAKGEAEMGTSVQGPAARFVKKKKLSLAACNQAIAPKIKQLQRKTMDISGSHSAIGSRDLHAGPAATGT